MSRTTAAELRGAFGRFLRALEAHGVDTAGMALEHYAYGTPKWRVTGVGGGALNVGATKGEVWHALGVASAALEYVTDRRVDSPSAWSYRESQENGDGVDCRACGNPLNDDLPILNDAEGYAVHEGCLSA